MNSPAERTKRLSLKEKIGQMLVVGFGAGTDGEKALRRVVSETSAGNIILFARNTPDAQTAARSAAFARALVETETGIAPLVSIDQEGGIVARISRGITPLPGAMALSAGSSPDEVTALCAAVAHDLRDLGMDWNLGPVADVNVNPANPVIGVRSFGGDPQRVAEYATAWFVGMRAGGVACCAKHFPGHGDTSVDSHLDLPEIAHSMERLEAVELVPFRALIAAGVPSVLTAHVRFPAVEPRPLPATLSPAVIQGLLRGSLGFRGVVVTDCMEMKAIADHFPDAAVMAVEAGVDMVMVSHTAEVQIEAAHRILAAVLSGRIPESRIDESVGRILAMKDRVSAIPGSAGACAGALELARRLSAQSLSFAGTAPFPGLSSGGFYIDVLPAKITRAEDAAFEAEKSPAQAIAGSILSRLSGSHWKGCVIPARPTEDAVSDCLGILDTFLCANAGSGLPVVFGLYNAASDPSQFALAQKTASRCRAAGYPFACISTRSPYDASIFPDVAVVCAYEYTELSARSVAAFLSGEIGATGVYPVKINDLNERPS